MLKRFKHFWESTFDNHADYWLNKKSVPDKLQTAITPYINKELKVLDLGCGGGRLAAALVPGFQKVYGIDGSEQLLNKAAKENPETNLVCGNFQSAAVWKSLNTQFDVIVSNCAVRKDYCGNLPQVASLCHEHLNPNGALIMRIQAFEDLKPILPEELRKSIFYSSEEIQQIFSQFNVQVEHENYVQKFSSENYVRTFLERINIQYDGPIRLLNIPRHYYIVKATKRN